MSTGSRSPHYDYAPANGAMSPAEERLILRELNVDAGTVVAVCLFWPAGWVAPAELRQRIRALGAAS